jgi:hypothetical protein
LANFDKLEDDKSTTPEKNVGKWNISYYLAVFNKVLKEKYHLRKNCMFYGRTKRK